VIFLLKLRGCILSKLKSDRSIFWFRQDLRLENNPALLAASKCGEIIPVFILDEVNNRNQVLGAASKLWLHNSLQALNIQLGGKLRFMSGNPKVLLPELAKKNSVTNVFWNRAYEPWRIARDTALKNQLTDEGLEVQSFNGTLLWEPWQIMKKDGTPYKVFTPFYRKGCLSAKEPKLPQPSQGLTILEEDEWCGSKPLNDLKLKPKKNWGEKITDVWGIGEKAAQKRLKQFLNEGLNGYKEGRNYPSKANVSRLSAHLHWGEISINTVWYTTKAHADREKLNGADIDTFLSELGWREFSNSLLYNFPELPTKNLQERFDNFEWIDNPSFLKLWQKGKTGYPIVDAGMRELWQTGYMHNRLRMIVGSFLVKNLLIDWRQGEKWFWDCLVDANLASNSASWQWIAGCGADAAPYFRIFNPITQGKKFDPDATYIKKYVPELSALPIEHIFSPWEAPEATLETSGVILGQNYPLPIVDLKKSRENALSTFAKLKETKSLGL
jgi:deoxyribodipyrimidine photo-lyase